VSSRSDKCEPERQAFFSAAEVVRKRHRTIEVSSGILDEVCGKREFALFLVYSSLLHLRLRSNLESQRCKVCLIIKAGIGFSDLSLCLLQLGLAQLDDGT